MKPMATLDNPKTEIYCGDCIEIAPTLGKFDLVFADPPFNIGQRYSEFYDSMPSDEYARFEGLWIGLVRNAMTQHGSVWANLPDSLCWRTAHGFSCSGLYLNNWCIWHYRFGQCQKTKFISSKQHVLWFVANPKEFTFNAEAIHVQSDRVKYGDKRTQATEHPGMRVPLDVWEFPRIQGNNKERRKGHPNQIPEAYYARIVEACSNPGDRCLDMFAGSGGFGTVARALGRESVSIEISKQSADSAWERINAGPVRDIGQVTA